MKHLLFIIVVFVGIMASCSSDSSDDVLSMGEMEDILYDIHLSQNMNEGVDAKNITLKDISNRQAIFKKYEITEAEWDSSFTYYCRHSDKLHQIYQNLTERIRDEVVDLGGDVSIDDEHLSGDTTNIWSSDRSFILMPQTPYNLKTFALSSDSTFKAGDLITMQFDCKFIFQDGSRDMTCIMAITLGNDSVVSQVRHVSSDGINSVMFRDTEHLGIKSVKGYFILSRGINDQAITTFRLVSLENVKMILVHEKEEFKKDEKTNPVNEKDSLSDSIHSAGPRTVGMRPEDRPTVGSPSQHP